MKIEKYQKTSTRIVKRLKKIHDMIIYARKYTITLVVEEKENKENIKSGKILGKLNEIGKRILQEKTITIYPSRRNTLITCNSLNEVIENYDKCFDMWFLELVQEMFHKSKLSTVIVEIIGAIAGIIGLLMFMKLISIPNELILVLASYTAITGISYLFKEPIKAKYKKRVLPQAQKIHEILIKSNNMYRYYYNSLKTIIYELLMLSTKCIKEYNRNLKLVKYEVKCKKNKDIIIAKIIRK